MAAFWGGIVEMGALTSTVTQAQRAPFDMLFGHFGANANPGQFLMDALANLWAHSVSPYQSNPLDINPLKGFLEDLVDFERLAACHSGVLRRLCAVLATLRKRGRVVDCTGLENRQRATVREFESHRFRQNGCSQVSDVHSLPIGLSSTRKTVVQAHSPIIPSPTHSLNPLAC